MGQHRNNNMPATAANVISAAERLANKRANESQAHIPIVEVISDVDRIFGKCHADYAIPIMVLALNEKGITVH